MERRNPNSSTEEELAFLKAAAWIWYQHGSGSSEGKPQREFNLIATWRAPGPSRYKLEATRIADENTARSSSSSSWSPSINLTPIHTDNSLLDQYEVGRISKHLEYLIEANSAGNRHHRKEYESVSPESRKKKKSNRLVNGLLLRQAAGICGSREDVVEGIMLGGRRLPQYGSVIGLAKCRPRAKDAK
ncbi:uncharacterized protein LOC122078949 [Macadamia integrifolia]|uniref:uncharacterized protein LOC122078949 n=1 Tax=Macadamia integrifolia TaxID=60698 RepID=UPI001C4E3771|nr:uncharacterized protein LOC122078949 [Macadamia integrifolia]